MRIILTIIVLICLIPSVGLAKEQTVINRYALIVGANDGGDDRVKLRYAQTDATQIAQVFRELGGVDTRQQILLLEPQASDLLTQLEKINQTLTKKTTPGIRNEFIFYYSGHSNERGLLLGEELLEYKHLHRAIGGIQSDVKVAILDSCASGAFTRMKGGKRRPSFLVDESSKVSGHAYLASSSVDESAQESDVIGGSYFTHFLVSGLRGAGDLSRDKRVTLNEAYQFAFHETLARTESSMFGAQHAAYDIQLAGAGDLVLTDLHQASSTLVLPKDLTGHLFIRKQNGQLFLELRKHEQKEIVLGMDPGSYRLQIEKDEYMLKMDFELEKDRSLIVDESRATRVSLDSSRARGEKSAFDPDDYQRVEAKFSLAPGLEWRSEDPHGKREIVNLDVNFFVGQTDRLDGVGIGTVISYIKEDSRWFQLSGVGNYVGGNGEGVQIALSGGNLVYGGFKGAQGALVFNYVNGSLEGGAGAGAFNFIQGGLIDGGVGAGGFNVVRGPVKGGVGAGGFNLVFGDLLEGGLGAAGFNIVTGNAKGGMGAAGFNIVDGDMKGGMGSAGFNIVKGNLNGGQGAAGFNMALGDAKGIQGAAGFNLSNGEHIGAQFAAGLNMAKELNGVQVATLNIGGSVNGVQLGVVNIAKEFKGVPVGLLSLYGNGRHDLGISTDDQQYTRVSYKSGTHRIYNYLDLAFSASNPSAPIRMGWGMGVHKKVSNKAFIDTDVTFGSDLRVVTVDTQVLDKSIKGLCLFCAYSNNTVSLRSALGMRPAKYFSFLAGVSLNLLYDDSETSALPPSTVQSTMFTIGNTRYRMWPGFFGSIEF